MVYFSEICAFPKRQVFHAQNKHRNQQHLLDLNYRSYRGSCSCIFIAVRPWKEMKLCQEILRDVVGVWGWGGGVLAKGMHASSWCILHISCNSVCQLHLSEAGENITIMFFQKKERPPQDFNGCWGMCLVLTQLLNQPEGNSRWTTLSFHFPLDTMDRSSFPVHPSQACSIIYI